MTASYRHFACKTAASVLYFPYPLYGGMERGAVYAGKNQISPIPCHSCRSVVRAQHAVFQAAAGACERNYAGSAVISRRGRGSAGRTNRLSGAFCTERRLSAVKRRSAVYGRDGAAGYRRSGSADLPASALCPLSCRVCRYGVRRLACLHRRTTRMRIKLPGMPCIPGSGLLTHSSEVRPRDPAAPTADPAQDGRSGRRLQSGGRWAGAGRAGG